MFTLPAVVILLSGIFNRVFHASAVRRQDAFLQQYETQATQLLEKVSRGIQCHKRLRTTNRCHQPPKAAVLSSLDECDASHDAVSLHLRDARNTAQQPNFPVDKLHDQKLPDVLDTRETQQGEYTENLHTQLKQLSETAAASKAYQAGDSCSN
ncbi:hypothetical protein J3459_014649 [Metarhizium acridum]|nr:hypothetical protein J3459_014649 [Metarhizium acridum]